ncbi:CD109 antigen-like [Littorina saxatilis]|uniref:Uncharacterized protein n=1 Tax=Littorina saxatilis TaxID=31220 RepID=A0AAN9B2M7_9CAEN
MTMLRTHVVWCGVLYLLAGGSIALSPPAPPAPATPGPAPPAPTTATAPPPPSPAPPPLAPDQPVRIPMPIILPKPITPSPAPTTEAPLKDMTYWVSFAKKVRPGAPLAVSVLLSNASGPVTLRLDLMDYDGDELQDGQNFTLDASENVQTVQFNIGKDLKREYRLWVRARAWGGLEFDGFERVTRSSKRLSVFIQTDKAKYQPGQTVQFRALAMLPDLQVSQDSMDIVITDPHNNRIAQWLGVKSDDETGVFQGEMTTSLFPPLGAWKIKATVDGVSEEKSFTLEEYELPQFEVKLDLPGYALVTGNKTTAKVSAKYTFGSPIQGSGSIVATLNIYRTSPVSVVKEFELDSDGQAEVEFTNEELYDLAWKTYTTVYSWYTDRNKRYFNLNYKTFDFTATVTDALTDDVMADKASFRFYNRDMNLRFLQTSPSTFKPGLSYFGQLEALKPDNTPVDNPQDIEVTFNVTYYRDLEPDEPFTTRYYWQQRPRVQDVLLTKTVGLDKFGLATLKIAYIPKTAYSVNIAATYGEIKTNKYLSKFTSPGNVFLRLKTKTRRPKVGRKVKLQALSNVKFGDFTYQVFSKGNLVLSGVVCKGRPNEKKVFNFPLSSAMAPVADVIVFFEADDGEVVVDRVAIGVDDVSENKVELKFVPTEVKPGDMAKLNVKAQPRSTVFLLGLDKSVLLLGTGNDVTRDQMISELAEYNSGNSYIFRGFWCFPVYFNDANNVFEGAGAGIITDGDIPGKDLNDVPKPFRTKTSYDFGWGVGGGPIMMRDMAMVAAPAPMMANAAAPAGPPPAAKDSAGQGESDTPAERVRTLFPETWLWDTVDMKTKVSTNVKVKTPDTITTWVVSAFAVHPKMGLAFAEKPAELVSIKRLFIKLDLPYSALRGEDVCFTAITFNRYDEPVQVSIGLAMNASAFQNTLVKRDATSGDVSEVRESILVNNDLGTLQPEAVVSTVFCVSPLSLGDMPVQVYLTADRPADALIRTIRIKPEGVERSQSYPVLIELDEGKQFSNTVNLSLPEEFVQGSLRITVAVVGDVLGVVAENLEDLLKMPYGCGEQNMINFAPNTYLIAYLRNTGRLSSAILSKAKSFMLAGYQKELQYQRSDGSFSAFGNRDKAGSMWLTAFVTKCFVQATGLGSDVITIDPSVVSKAVSWMTQYQNKDGSFREPGRVIHRAMQGGSATGVGLAAYVVITLKEAENAFSDDMSNATKSQVSSALSKGVAYLEGQLTSLGDDVYTSCIVAYALTLAGSDQAGAARNNMNQLASSGATVKYWSGPVEVKQTYYSWYRKTDALSIEMTSYALLTLMQDAALNDAIPVFRWLNKQRGPKGGFVSTQDTVVGIEALAAMSDLALGSDFSPITVQVSGSGSGQPSSLTINENNVLLLQKLELPLENGAYPDQVTITATSDTTERAFALAEVVVTYNVDTSTEEQTFSADTTVSNNTARSFVLTTCVQRNQGNATGAMVLTEIGVPSGYDVDKRKSDFGSASRVEYPEGEVVLYYNSLDAEEQCSVMTMRMSKGIVAHTKPAAVRVYDYYKPDDEFTTSYSVKQFGVCDLEPQYMDCPFAK